MRTLIVALTLLATSLAHADDYDVMRIDFPAEHTAKVFAGCTNYPQGNDSNYVIWCADTYTTAYIESNAAGRPVFLGTIDTGFEWYSDLMGACRLHSIIDHTTYTSYAFSCYTDRISSDGFEPFSDGV